MPFIRLALFIYIVFITVFSARALSAVVDVSKNYSSPIGASIVYFQEQDDLLTANDALTVFSSQYDASEFRVQQSNNEVLSFGINANPVWLSITFNNPSSKIIKRDIEIANSWIDSADIYFFQENQLTAQSQVGDVFNYNQRGTSKRFFDASYNFSPGYTQVLIRFETTDPLVIPIYILSEEQANENSVINAYSYGVLYGAIISLLLYNFILFVSLKRSQYLFYSVYLFCFIAMNIAYTGHGFKWFWPEAITWQMWSNPVLMFCFNLSGLVFAHYFLNLKYQSPKIYKLNVYICSLFLLFFIGACTFSDHLYALGIAFVFMLVYPLLMVLLGVVASMNKSVAAKYFLVGSILAAIGGGITGLAVLGIIPFNVMTFRAIEIGMLIDVILLALALAELFRDTNNKKIVAENMALTDPLTGIGNRRSVYESINEMWFDLMESKSAISVLLLDIDKFKLINDKYGHSFGDEVIIKVADIVKQNARSLDIVGRWGGEEFIIILPNILGLDTKIVAQRICKSIENTLFEMGNEVEKVTVSCGVAILDDEKSIDELINSADIQLYNAKTRGRNCVCSTTDIKAPATAY